MELDGKPECLGGFEDLLGFGNGKSDAFAKGVHGIDQPGGMGGGKGFGADQIDVGLVVVLEFGGESVGAKEGCIDIYRARSGPGFGRRAASSVSVSTSRP